MSRQFLLVGVLWLQPFALLAQGAGTIAGTVATASGDGLGGVSVRIESLAETTLTDSSGAFVFPRVPAGTYSLSFALGEFASRESAVVVVAGEVTARHKIFEWDFSFGETLTVQSASRRRERLVEAPAAMTMLSAQDIALEGGTGQLPALLQFTVGAEATQNGLYDFNLNTRGFNGFLNRRVQVVIDGRDPAIPSCFCQEWWTIGMLANDLESMELLRGPSAALYGPNSVNGVLNLTTRAPRDSQGGALGLTLGDLDMLAADVRWAGDLGREWYLKVLGHYTETETFARSRTGPVEYPGLPAEVLPLLPGGVDFRSGLLRADKYLANGDVLTLEAGGSAGDGETFLTDVGRFQELAIERSWVRFNYNSLRWNAALYWNSRDGDHALLPSAALLVNDDNLYNVEIQFNRPFAGGRLRLVAGVAAGHETLDTADDNGVQTLYFEAVETDEQAVFGQLDYDATDKLKLVLALRWDDSTLHDPELSPKASLVYQPTPDHSLRLGYNQAFQVGTYSELFLSIPAGPPLDLSALEEALAPLAGDVPLGLGLVPAFAFGNTDLAVEQIRSVDVGYKGILGQKTLLRVDYFFNRMEDFITGLIPGVNPADFPPYRAPPGIGPAAAAIIEQTVNSAVPGLNNDPVTGAPRFVLSYGNTGKVDSQGLELALSHQLDKSWLVDLNYSWFDFEVRQETPGAEVHPNVARHKGSLGLSYRQDRLAASLRYRWVDEFFWSAGIYAGTVPAYSVVELHANFDLTDRWRIGLSVRNALNDEHFEAFGGDILGRRAMADLSVTW